MHCLQAAASLSGFQVRWQVQFFCNFFTWLLWFLIGEYNLDAFGNAFLTQLGADDTGNRVHSGLGNIRYLKTTWIILFAAPILEISGIPRFRHSLIK